MGRVWPLYWNENQIALTVDKENLDDRISKQLIKGNSKEETIIIKKLTALFRWSQDMYKTGNIDMKKKFTWLAAGCILQNRWKPIREKEK